MSLYLIIKDIPHPGLPLNLTSDSFTLVGHKTPAPIPITLSFRLLLQLGASWA